MGDDEVGAALERAQVLDDLGRDREALDLLVPLLGRHPDHADLVVGCARLLMASGTADGLAQGRALARRAVAIDPQDADALAVLGLGLTANPLRWREARPATEQVVAIAPHDPAGAGPVRRRAGRAAAARGPRCRAAAAEIALEELNPFDRTASAEVDALIARALALDPEGSEAHVLRARADLDGTSGQRQAAYLEAVRLDPTSREALAGIDDELTFPLRLGFWLMWVLVALQAVLLLTGVRPGPVPGLVALLLVLPLADVLHRARRRRRLRRLGA